MKDEERHKHEFRFDSKTPMFWCANCDMEWDADNYEFQKILERVRKYNER